MTGDKGQTAESGGRDKYEATVMEFLDKETSAVQLSQKPKEYSEDLEAIVSDLMQQVLRETDQKTGPNAESGQIEDLLAEFLPPREETPAHKDRGTAPDPAQRAQNAAVPAPAEEGARPKSTAAAPGKAPAVKAAATKSHAGPQPALFAAPGQGRRKPPVLAVVIAGLLIAGGAAAYVFMRPASQAPEQAPAPPVAASSGAASGAPVQSTVAVEQPAPAPAPQSNRSAGPEASKRTPAVSPQGRKSSNEAGQKPAPVHAAPAAPHPESAAQAPPAAAPPVLTAKSEPVEKQAPPAVPEPARTAEPAAEIKPAPGPAPAAKPSQAVPVVSATAATAQPDPQPSVAAAPRAAVSAVPITRANPQYPELAIRARMSATVVLDVSIDSQGKVIKAVPASGPAIFHNEAIRAAMKWRYKPATIDGTNVPSQSKIVFNFNLKK